MPDTLYTSEVREFIYSAGWPRGLQLDVFEQSDRLIIMLYVDNLLTFSMDEIKQIRDTLNRVTKTLFTKGIPTQGLTQNTRQYD